MAADTFVAGPWNTHLLGQGAQPTIGLRHRLGALVEVVRRAEKSLLDPWCRRVHTTIMDLAASRVCADFVHDHPSYKL